VEVSSEFPSSNSKANDVEIVAVWALVETYFDRGHLFTFLGQYPLLLLAGMWAFAIVLFLYTALRIAIAFKTEGLFKRVDVRISAGNLKRSTVEVLLGAAIWRAQFL
jgi:hypothetical protein